MSAASIRQGFDRAEPFAGPRPVDRVRIAAKPFRWPEASSLERRPWVYGRWLLRRTVTAIVAPGGVGKSSLVGSMILALASGRDDILGKTVWDGPKTVWYWNLEDDMAELEMQLTAASCFHRVGDAACGDRVYLNSGRDDDSELCIATEDREGFKIAVPVVDALIAELLARSVDVLVIDPFVSSHGVSENDNGAIDAVAKTWAKIAKEANCAVVLVHHSKKLAGEKVTAESSRGAVALIAAARVTLVLNRMDKVEAEKFGVQDDKERRRLFTVGDDKGNRAPAEDAVWFRLASQDVGNAKGPDDPYGDAGDSVGVVTRWTPADPFEGVSVDHLRRVQEAIETGEYKEHHSADDWVGHAVGGVLGWDMTEKAVRTRVTRLLKQWIDNGVLRVEKRRDKNRQEKKFVVVGRRADDLSATPAHDVASQGVAPSQQSAMLHPAPFREAGVATAAAEGLREGKGYATGRRGEHPSGNPALGRDERDRVDLSKPVF